MEKTLERISKLGPLIAMLIAVASAWGASQWKLDAIAKSQEKLEQHYSAVDEKLGRIASDLSALQAGSYFTREAFADLRNRVQQLEARR